MINLKICFTRKGEGIQAKCFQIPEDQPISIAEMQEQFVPSGYTLISYAFNHLGLI